MSSPNSKATASSLPKITDLRKLLNFGDTSSSQAQGFNEIVRAFRKTYRTSTGFAGVDLYDWKSKKHQSELSEMTRVFLEDQNYGKYFWPDIEGDVGNSIKLEYSKNQKFIMSTMKQLFFRLNQQQFRNSKYKRRDVNDLTSLNRRGKSLTDPIHVDDGESEPDNASRPHTPSHPYSSIETLQNDSGERAREAFKGFGVHQSPPRTLQIGHMSSGSRFEPTNKRQNTASDVYDVPSSPDRVDRTRDVQNAISTSLRKRAGGDPTFDRYASEAIKRSSLQSTENREERHPAKRQRTQEVGSEGDVLELAELSPPSSSGKRKSARSRTQRKINGVALSEDIEAALGPFEPAAKAPISRLKLPQTKTSPKRMSYSLGKPDSSSGNPVVANVLPSSRSQNLPQESAPQTNNIPEIQQSQPQAKNTPEPQQQLQPQISSIRELQPEPQTNSMPEPIQQPEPQTSSMSEPIQQSEPQTSSMSEPIQQSESQTLPRYIATTAAAAAAEPSMHQTPKPNEPAKQSYRPKTRLNLIYRVIKSREPFYDCELWIPKGGRFQEKSLEEVVQEMPKTNSSADMTALMFTLCGPNTRFKATIELHDEANFASMKTIFTRQITACLSKATEESLLLEMEIEPVYKDEQVKEELGDGSEDAVW